MTNRVVLSEELDASVEHVFVDSAKDAAKFVTDLLTGITPVVLVLQRVREAAQSVATGVSFDFSQRGPNDKNFVLNVYCREEDVASIAEKIGTLEEVQNMWFRWSDINIFIRPVIVREDSN